jgi:hypothetical protein
MKSKILIGSLLAITGIVFFSCSGNVQNETSSKELKVSYLGFNTSIDNYFIPGENVELLARANKKGVTYTWNLPGEWKEIDENKISWKVPEEEGVYKLSVDVTDEKSKQTVNKSIDVTVSDDIVCATPNSFSCKVTTNITMNNKLIGEDKQTTVSSIEMNSDNSVYVETIETNGDITRTYADSEAVYDIDSNGNRNLVAKNSKNENLIPTVNILGLASLKNSCSDYETDGRFYKFRQSSSTQKAEVEYDSMLGVITRIRSEDEENMEVSDILMDYDVIDGYIIPKKISGIVTYYVVGEKFTTKIEEEITDVIINEIEEE